MTMRAVLVARVSTPLQAEQGRSIESQFEAMRQYAARIGATVIDELEDDISGVVPIRERKGGQALYRYIDRRECDAVIFYTIDRITRDEDLIEINVLRRDCRNAGIELHYAADGGKADLTTWGGVIDTLKAAGAAEDGAPKRSPADGSAWAQSRLAIAAPDTASNPGWKFTRERPPSCGASLPCSSARTAISRWASAPSPSCSPTKVCRRQRARTAAASRTRAAGISAVST